MIEQGGGWFVVNVRDARWVGSEAFGRRCIFEGQGRFPHTGVRLAVLEPGKPACRYHRENAQEDFLVLSGECSLLVNDEERRLRAWDYFHCPPGVSHVLRGGDSGPCLVVMIGHRPPDHRVFYPASDAARRWNAESPEPTPDRNVAYSDVPPWTEIAPPGTFP